MGEFDKWLGKLDNVREWVEEAEKGDGEAQYHVAVHIFNEVDLSEDDTEIIERALGYLRKSAMSGYAQAVAAVELGELYYKGKHIPQDFQKALVWFRTAAQHLHPIGYYNLGECFFHGRGIPQDYAKAFDCYAKGALQNYTNAFIILGDMFKEGLFVERDPRYAVKLFYRVFDSDWGLYEKYDILTDAYGQACLRLGELYLHGSGVAKNVKEANRFFADAKKFDKDVGFMDNETPALLDLMHGAPYPENEAEDKNDIEVEARSWHDMEFDNENVPTDSLEAYFYIIEYLLLHREKSIEPYKCLAELYHKLFCFETDQPFVEFCQRASKKLEKDKNDN